ncbi:uncharacterized protein MONBRDRAFT_8370 [Monosiga brevicollis MX1]|uniref:Uncharacterized protein n=1 Tax=Monosiga brevicollis TaxID=81824 RepID=A9UZV8_MONBE|nr:uncharacterized protein MONBRDRAFT_8370 [Monosiga brevicollis MX1]EDQ89302.1 predicted protein [Monosiga brevicollis MX1]|eukprot:XP_001745878.1 hypothetical protein [Monosiga brevicollis MX1]
MATGPLSSCWWLACARYWRVLLAVLSPQRDFGTGTAFDWKLVLVTSRLILTHWFSLLAFFTRTVGQAHKPHRHGARRTRTLTIIGILVVGTVVATGLSLWFVQQAAVRAARSSNTHDARLDATGQDLALNISLNVPYVSKLHAADINGVTCSLQATRLMTQNTTLSLHVLDLGNLVLSSPLPNVLQGGNTTVQLAYRQDEPGRIAAKLIVDTYGILAITCSLDLTIHIWNVVPVPFSWTLDTVELNPWTQDQDHTLANEKASSEAKAAQNSTTLAADVEAAINSLLKHVQPHPAKPTCLLPVSVQMPSLFLSMLDSLVLRLPATGFVLSARTAQGQVLNMSEVTLQGLDTDILSSTGIEICASGLLDVHCASDNCRDALTHTDQAVQLVRDLYANLTLDFRTDSRDETSRSSFWGRFLSLDHDIVVTVPPALLPFRQPDSHSDISDPARSSLENTGLGDFWADAAWAAPNGARTGRASPINSLVALVNSNSTPSPALPSDVQAALMADCLDVSFDARFSQRLCAVWNRAASHNEHQRLYGGELHAKWDDRSIVDLFGGAFWPTLTFDRLPGVLGLRLTKNNWLLNTTFVATYDEHEQKAHLVLTNDGPGLSSPFELRAGGRWHQVSNGTQRLEGQLVFETLRNAAFQNIHLQVRGDFPRNSVTDLTLNVSRGNKRVLQAALTQPTTTSALGHLNITNVAEIFFDGRFNSIEDERFLNLSSNIPAWDVQFEGFGRLTTSVVELNVSSTGAGIPFALEAIAAYKKHRSNGLLISVDGDNQEQLFVNASATYVDPSHSASLAVQLDQAASIYHIQSAVDDVFVDAGAVHVASSASQTHRMLDRAKTAVLAATSDDDFVSDDDDAPAPNVDDDDDENASDDDVDDDDAPVPHATDQYRAWGSFAGLGYLANLSTTLDPKRMDWPLNMVVTGPRSSSIQNVSLRLTNVPTKRTFEGRWLAMPSSSHGHFLCDFHHLSAINVSSALRIRSSPTAPTTVEANCNALVDAASPDYEASTAMSIKADDQHLLAQGVSAWRAAHKGLQANVTWNDITSLTDLSLQGNGKVVRLITNASRHSPGDIVDAELSSFWQHSSRAVQASLDADVAWHKHQDLFRLSAQGVEPWAHNASAQGTLDLGLLTKGSTLGPHSAEARVVIVPSHKPWADALMRWDDIQLNSSVVMGPELTSGRLDLNLTRLDGPTAQGLSASSLGYGALSYSDVANFRGNRLSSANLDARGTGTVAFNLTWDEHRNVLTAQATGVLQDEEGRRQAAQLTTITNGPVLGKHDTELDLEHDISQSLETWSTRVRFDDAQLQQYGSASITEDGNRRAYSGTLQAGTFDFSKAVPHMKSRWLNAVFDALWRRARADGRMTSMLDGSVNLDWDRLKNQLALTTQVNASSDGLLYTSARVLANLEQQDSKWTSNATMLWQDDDQQVEWHAAVITADSHDRLMMLVDTNDEAGQVAFWSAVTVDDVNVTAIARATRSFDSALFDTQAVRVIDGHVTEVLFQSSVNHQFHHDISGSVTDESGPVEKWAEDLNMTLRWNDDETATIHFNLMSSWLGAGKWIIGTSADANTSTVNVGAVWSVELDEHRPAASIIGTTRLNDDLLHAEFTFDSPSNHTEVACTGYWNSHQWDSKVWCASNWQEAHVMMYVSDLDMRSLSQSSPGLAATMPRAPPFGISPSSALWSGALAYDVRDQQAMMANWSVAGLHQQTYSASVNASRLQVSSVQWIGGNMSLNLGPTTVDVSGVAKIDSTKKEVHADTIGQVNGTPFGLTLGVQQVRLTSSITAYWSSTDFSAFGELASEGRNGTLMLLSHRDRLSSNETLIFNVSTAYWTEATMGAAMGLHWTSPGNCVSGFDTKTAFWPAHDFQIDSAANVCHKRTHPIAPTGSYPVSTAGSTASTNPSSGSGKTPLPPGTSLPAHSTRGSSPHPTPCIGTSSLYPSSRSMPTPGHTLGTTTTSAAYLHSSTIPMSTPTPSRGTSESSSPRKKSIAIVAATVGSVVVVAVAAVLGVMYVRRHRRGAKYAMFQNDHEDHKDQKA